MGTRSVIGVMEGDVCKAVYCNWDGYFAHNGEILNRFYNDVAKATQLVSMGHISALGVEIGQQHDFNADVGDHESGFNAQCTFYNRDRGEEYSVQTLTNWEDFTEYFLNGCGGEYAYIMKDGVWYTCTDRDLTLRVLAAELELTTA
jgi:hypothetical protein